MTTAQIATVPERIESLKLTIKSLLPQVDLLRVMCNNYTIEQTQELDRFFDSDKLWCFKRYNETGAGEKFYGVDDLSGYLFTCDDDLIYAKNYISKLTEYIERYDGKAVISFHGRKSKPGKINSYYKDKTEFYHCLWETEGFHQVTSGGTGVMGWDQDKIKFSYKWQTDKNMADVMVAVALYRLNVPIIVAPHKKDWLKVGYNGENTIWHKQRNNDKIRTEAWNAK